MRLPSIFPRAFAFWSLLLGGVWLALGATGWLDGLEQWTLNERYRVRGPIESGAKVYYVNRDAAASRQFGVAWFPREYYAMAGEALLDLGGARSVLLDFVLTSDHLPRSEAPALTYAGNLAMQRFLLTHPNQVVLGAAYGGKRHPFCAYASVLPDRLDGPFVLTGGLARGYDPARNPLPDLPEFPLWCPPIDLASFPFPGIGEVGLINTSQSINHGEQVDWVPATVEVNNRFPSLFLINGMRRWQETVAWHGGRAESFTAEEDAEALILVVRDGQGVVLNGVPSTLALDFLTASLRLLQFDHPGSSWHHEDGRLVLVGLDGAVLRRVPLRAAQHLAVNWYSPWHVGSEDLREEVEAIAQTEADQGLANWDVPQIGKDPAGWIEAVERGDPLAIDPIRPWGQPNDPYNPKVSIADVLFFYDAYGLAEEMGAEHAMTFIRELFEQFKDAYILIGPTDPLLQDLAPTPFDDDATPKVAVHGNLLKTLVDERFLHFSDPLTTVALTLLLAFLVGAAATSGGARNWLHKVAGFGLLLGYLVLAVVLFGAFQWVLPVAAPVGAASSAGVLGIGLRLWEEERQKARIRQLFGTYVSPDVVDLMVDSAEEPQLGGHVREVTAFFTDIEAFSSIGEQLTPDVLVELMNEYLDTMTGVLNQEQGTLDKYIGDAIVGIFGAPLALGDHAARACSCAVRMQLEQQRLRGLWQASQSPWPERVRRMRTRIGIHTGDAVVGNMGSKQRFTYTMMGDSVNLASRLEQLCKTYGTSILVSESTRVAALRDAPHLVFRFLDLVAVKGRRAPVKVYELLGYSERLDGGQLECVAIYEAAMEAYLKRDWSGAAALFSRSGRKERRREETLHPSKVMEARCMLYSASPPAPDWDGVFVMTRK